MDRKEPPEWQVAVFCHNERERIAACLSSVAAAIGSHCGLITVISNGSTDGSEAAAQAAAASLGVPIEVFRIEHADKASAINSFLYQPMLRGDAELYFFVDGYVTVGPTALSATALRLGQCPRAVAASGVAISGRTATRSTQRAVEVGGVMHGQFFCLKPEFVRRMVDQGIRLPVGLYRGDGLLGSMAAHDLDAVGQPWVDGRLIGVADAQFAIDALSPFRPRDLRRQFRRKIRQMRGKLENAAIKKVIYARGYAALPASADDLIRDFLAEHPGPPVSLLDQPFMRLALRQLRRSTRPDPETLLPHRVR